VEFEVWFNVLGPLEFFSGKFVCSVLATEVMYGIWRVVF
jgi:hypothetical protein